MMVFNVSLKDATSFPVTVHYVTSNGSATAGHDSWVGLHTTPR
jgi:hypothetical protein